MENIITTADQAETLSASFVTRIGGFQTQVDACETKAQEHATTNEYNQLGSETDPGVRKIVKQANRNAARREARQYHRNLVASTEGERTERLKALLAIDAEATKLGPLFESPVQMLSRMGLGSPERDRYQNQLRDAGPRELQNHAEWARYKGDRILAAAVLSRLDTLPATSRPFKATEFATSIIGEDFQATRKAIERIRQAAQRAVNANRDFERGRTDAVAKISMGLARRHG
jgi:hypothetical protein